MVHADAPPMPAMSAPSRVGLIDPRSGPAYRLLAAMVTSVAVLTIAFGFSIDRQDMPVMIGALLFLMASGMALRSRGLGRAGTAVESVALILASTMAVCCLSTLLAATAPPYRDVWLDHADRWIMPAFNWLDMFHLLRGHAALIHAMETVYSSLLWQPFALVAALSLTGRERDSWRFLHAWFLTLMLCAIVFAWMPAVGTYGFYHLAPHDIPAMRLRVGWEQQAVLDAVRSGHMRSLSPSEMAGIIAFPSFHAAGATLLAWSWRKLPVAGPIFVAWNVAMIATAPLIGSHYFCDVAAGIAVALLAIRTATHSYDIKAST
jgi:hypothetical protein